MIEQLPDQPRFVLIGVERVEPAAPPPLAEIREQVRTAFIAARRSRPRKAVADAVAARINGGMPAARAFAEAQPRVPASQSVDLQRLQISRGGQQVPPPLITLFSIPQGRARVLADAGNNGWFIVAHAAAHARRCGAPTAADRHHPRPVQRTASEELAQQFARAVERGQPRSARRGGDRRRAARAARRRRAIAGAADDPGRRQL